MTSMSTANADASAEDHVEDAVREAGPGAASGSRGWASSPRASSTSSSACSRCRRRSTAAGRRPISAARCARSSTSRSAERCSRSAAPGWSGYALWRLIQSLLDPEHEHGTTPRNSADALRGSSAASRTAASASRRGRWCSAATATAAATARRTGRPRSWPNPPGRGSSARSALIVIGVGALAHLPRVEGEARRQADARQVGRARCATGSSASAASATPRAASSSA